MISFIKKKIRTLKRLLDPFIGKYIDMYVWKYRHYLYKNWEEGYLDSYSINHPHRNLILESISKKSDVRMILELGTGNGVNLIKLFEKFPKIKYIGIDINKRAISIGKQYLREHKIKNIKLNTDNIFSIIKMESSSIDYIITDAVLMYINPDDLKSLFNEMLRVSKFGLILCEQASPRNTYEDHWRHDYKTLSDTFPNIKSYVSTKITSDYWTGDWIKYGQIIEVEK